MHQYCLVSVSNTAIYPVSACRSIGSGSSPRCRRTCRSWRSNSCSRRRRRTPRDAWSKSSGYTRRATGQSSTRQGKENQRVEHKRRLSFALSVSSRGVTKRCLLPGLTNSALVYMRCCYMTVDPAMPAP